MAYNFTLAILPATTLEQDSASADLLTFDDVLTLGRAALVGTQLGAHVVLLDLTLGDRAKDYANTLGRQVYIVSFSGVSSTYVIEANGTVERLRVQIDGEIAVEHGTPLPVEQELHKHHFDEDAHAAVFEALLGTPLRRVFDAHFQELAVQ